MEKDAPQTKTRFHMKRYAIGNAILATIGLSLIAYILYTVA
jgi:hypothetical protein